MQVSIGAEVGLISKEYLGPLPLRWFQQRHVLRYEGFPPLVIGLQETLLGLLHHKSQTMQIVQATAPTES
jgi:hypothetical protein